MRNKKIVEGIRSIKREDDGARLLKSQYNGNKYAPSNYHDVMMNTAMITSYYKWFF